jgi:hypothetical protein
MSIVTDSKPVEAAKDPTGSTIFQLYSLVVAWRINRHASEIRDRRHWLRRF